MGGGSICLIFEVAELPPFKDVLLSLVSLFPSLLQLWTNKTIFPSFLFDTALRKCVTTIECFIILLGVCLLGGGCDSYKALTSHFRWDSCYFAAELAVVILQGPFTLISPSLPTRKEYHTYVTLPPRPLVLWQSSLAQLCQTQSPLLTPPLMITWGSRDFRCQEWQPGGEGVWGLGRVGFGAAKLGKQWFWTEGRGAGEGLSIGKDMG